MSYFTQDFIDFFAELKSNNQKEWFHANKKRYEASVKKPFEDFIEELILRVRADDPSVEIAPKQAIMRIYRDIRFSKDKTPYKTHASAIISAGGTKDKSVPGIYVHLGPNENEVRVYGGAHMVDKDQLHKIRTAIMNDPGAFEKLLNEKAFKETFGEVRGDKNKRIPPEFREAAEKQSLLMNKNYYYYKTFDGALILQDGLVDAVMDCYAAGKNMSAFFKQAMN